MGKRYLLIVRAGNRSHHPGWLLPEPVPRPWDLHISYFGLRENPFGELPPGVSLSRERGPKYIGLHECLMAQADIVDRYAYIGFPDDDLVCTAKDWTTT